MGKLENKQTITEIDLSPLEYKSKNNRTARIQFLLSKLLLTASIVAAALAIPFAIWIALQN